jgi:HlyD family secretion protein
MEVVAYPGLTFTGRIGFVAAALSPDNKSFPVEMVIPNPGHRLKPEMVARVKIMQSLRRNAILINGDIIQQVDQGKYLVYVEKDGRAMERTIRIGAREGGLVEITDGLRPGDLLITMGHQSLVDGQRVSVVK